GQCNRNEVRTACAPADGAKLTANQPGTAGLRGLPAGDFRGGHASGCCATPSSAATRVHRPDRTNHRRAGAAGATASVPAAARLATADRGSARRTLKSHIVENRQRRVSQSGVRVMPPELRYKKGGTIGGRYQVHRALAGGLGEVYLCRG